MKRFSGQTRLVSLLGLLVFLWTAAYGQITPSADSYTNTATPTTNNGAKTLLDVDGASQTTYIQFNLASIPTTASIGQATLKLYVNSVATAGSFNVDYVNSAWSESTIDASNAPTPGTTIASNVNVTTADKNQYILVDVTSAVQAWLGGSEANNGLALVANSTFNATFDSKENTATSHPPELDVAFAAGGGTITGVTAGTALTGGGTSGAVTLNLDTTQVPVLAANNYFTGNNVFQPFAADAIDAYTAWPGKTALVGIESATNGGSYGVWARTSDPSGAGVKGTNAGGTGGVGVYGTGDIGVYGTSSTGNNAMVANGNVSQSRTGGGWVKAMVFYDGENGGGLARCYNSTLTGAAATTPPCGFTLTATSTGLQINFGFEVDDRFLAMNLQRCSCGSEIPIWFATPESTNVISVAVFQAGTANLIPAQWHLIVF
jgi:hypothetical protein